MTEESSYPDEIIKSLSSSVHWGHDNLVAVPNLLRMVLENNMWRKRYVRLTEQIVEFEGFEDFVTALPPEGLGTSLQVLRSLCHEHSDLLTMISQIAGSSDVHRSETSDQSDTEAAQHLARQLLLERLHSDNQDEIAEELEQGRITLNYAAEAVGYKDLRIAVSKLDAASAAQTLINNLSPDVLRLLVRLLTERIPNDTTSDRDK